MHHVPSRSWEEEDKMAPRPAASLFALAAVVLLAGASVVAQAPSAKTAPGVARTPDGKPDLQGFWDFRTLTPLERPTSLADKPFLTEEEAKTLQEQNANRRARAAAPSDPRTSPRTPGGGGVAVGGYNDFWFDGGVSVVGDRRTSLIVDPPDGRVPALKAGAPRQIGSLMEDLPLQP